MPTKPLYAAVLAVSILLIPTTSHAVLFDNNKVVRDSRGKVVHASESGTCVRTDWHEGFNVCAPRVVEQKKVVVYEAPPPPPRIVQQRVEVLNKDERVVYFPFDSAELVPEAQAKLDNVATKLSAASSVRGADIVGFADRMGATNYNLTLSQQRAKAVQDYLSGRGYINTRIARTRGLGETNSVTRCDPSLPREDQIACLGADRRVELEVQYTETKVENRVIQPVAAPAPPIQGELMYSQPAVAATPARY